jgi:hypothetical protein
MTWEQIRCIAVTVVSAIVALVAALPASAEPPSNQQLFQMIMELQASTTQLKAATQNAEAEAAAAKTDLVQTKRELAATRAALETALQQQLETTEQTINTAVSEAVASEVAKIEPAAGAPGRRAVTSGRRPGGGHLEARAIYLRPDMNNLTYANVGEDLPAFDRFNHTEELAFGRGPAFRLSGGYRFEESGWDVSAAYSRLRVSDEGEIGVDRPAGGTGLEIRPAPLITPDDDSDYDFAHSSAKFRYDVADATFGQDFSVGESTDVALFFGPRAASIGVEQNASYVDDVENDQSTQFFWFKSSEFRGVGGRLGGELDYNIGLGVSLFGTAAGSLLYGKSTTRLHYDLLETQALNAGGTQRVTEEDRIVVPVVEASFGAAWNHELSDTSGIGFRIGYQFENWFNVHRDIEVEGFSRGADPRAGNVARVDSDDISLDGPFFQLRGYW